MIVDRRFFLKITGLMAAAGVTRVLAAGSVARDAPATRDAIAELQAPGTYQISGRVRLEQPLVVISGISNAQQISWTPGSLSAPVASFTSFERFDRAWSMPQIRVTGGHLEALRVVPLEFA